ncbi:hypothetical protein MTR_7g027090 [Medicago truncatula]|uniref:Uncharacterized protein n=1 Tax=Medicago truncatula TaxID=3880 RepID=G7L156_MEDTR|nr:hypothetical protein MTR_7g027090 [Medicago truncatula]
MGDFNPILSHDEKEGGNFGSSQIISMFRDTVQNHNLSDFGFEECWLHDSGTLEAVTDAWEMEGDFMPDKSNDIVNDLCKWSKDHFGDVPNQIKITQEKLDNLNKQSHQEGDLFSTSHPERISEIVEVVKDRLSDSICNILEREFTENEVFLAANNLKPHVVPGPHGMPSLFYQ